MYQKRKEAFNAGAGTYPVNDVRSLGAGSAAEQLPERRDAVVRRGSPRKGFR